MKIESFINKHRDEIIRHYQFEAWDLGYNRDEADGYASRNISHTFIGTKEELEKTFPDENDYYIICKEKGLYAAETFDGTEYDFLADEF